MKSSKNLLSITTHVRFPPYMPLILQRTPMITGETHGYEGLPLKASRQSIQFFPL